MKEFLKPLKKHHNLQTTKIDELFNAVIELSFLLTQYRSNKAGYTVGQLARQYTLTIRPHGADFSVVLRQALRLAVGQLQQARNPGHLKVLKRRVIRNRLARKFLKELKGKHGQDGMLSELSNESLLLWSIRY